MPNTERPVSRPRIWSASTRNSSRWSAMPERRRSGRGWRSRAICARRVTMRVRYYEQVSRQPLPSIAVLQDLDPDPGFGAFWGEVNTTIHKGLGCLGAVTNGSFRDIDACAPGFQLLGGKIGPSHAWVHLVEIACEVDVFGMVVKPDDIVHADRHGAVVVPADCVRRLPEAIDLLTRREALILAAAHCAGLQRRHPQEGDVRLSRDPLTREDWE